MLKEFTPPSMKGLNYNIDDDLILTDAWGKIRKTNNTGVLSLYGSDSSAGSGGIVPIHGSGGTGTVLLMTPNAAKNTDIIAVEISPGDAGLKTIDVKNNKIVSVLDPANAQDAATKNYVDGKFPAWSTWAPTLTWTGGTPTGISTTARYIQIGKIVHYMVYITATDSKGVTNLTISTPSTAANQGGVYCGSGFHGYGAGGTTFEDSFAVVVANTALIQYEKWTANTSGQGLYLASTGFYEVP